MDLEFIERATSLYKVEVEQSLKEDKLRAEIYNSHSRISRLRYEKSEKGKIARKNVCARRYQRMKESMRSLTSVEKKVIRDFYKNCPEGYHVDHVVPLSKGGRHIIENLQYIIPINNFKKAYKLGFSKELDGQINKTLKET